MITATGAMFERSQGSSPRKNRGVRNDSPGEGRQTKTRRPPKAVLTMVKSTGRNAGATKSEMFPKGQQNLLLRRVQGAGGGL